MARQNNPRQAPQDAAESSIDAETQARILKVRQQIAAYANFLRWGANFPKDEFIRHPRNDRVILMSPMQSGRFSFSLQGDTIYLGVQPFEEVWVSLMPVDKVYISDRLYLYVDGINYMDNKLSALAIGIFVDEPGKRNAMAKSTRLQPVQVQVKDGQVTNVGSAIGTPVPVQADDVVASLALAAKTRLTQKDTSRFF